MAKRSSDYLEILVPDETGELIERSADPVARVIVDVPLAHLDRSFEYVVPADLDDLVRPGVRVKVRFAGQDVDAYVLERVAEAEHDGRLSPLRRVVGVDAVLTPALLAVARRLANEHAGTLPEILRLAIPPRHARAEKACPAAEPASGEPSDAPALAGEASAAPGSIVDPGPWLNYPAGPSLLRRLGSGEAPAAAWSALPQPGGDWCQALAIAARVTLESGRGVVIVVPDHRDVARVEAALTEVVGRDRHVRLTADQGPQARYTAWLKLLRGHVRCVVGTRAAAFAPVREPGLLAWWDDGDDLHDEPRAPYLHVRDVLRARAEIEGAGLLAAGVSRSVAVQALVESGVLREVVPDAATRRRFAPRIHVAGQGREEERDGPAVRAHLPSSAWRAAREALERGPVLVQVPRRGYVPALSCAHCRARARCRTCHGMLAVPAAGQAPTCTTCGSASHAWACPECGGRQVRSTAVGARRTAEELGRAFPGVTVRTSRAGEVIEGVAADPALVIATPGAEPPAEGGYAATLLLDAWASLDRPALNAGQESLRRWMSAAALTRSAADGGVVVLAGVPPYAQLPAVEALVRWAPEWFAARELGERRELDLPPAAWTARLSGAQAALQEVLAALPAEGLPPVVERIGPVLTPDQGSRSAGGAPQAEGERPAQVLLRGPASAGAEAVAALGRLRRVRSVRRDTTAVTVQVGAADIGT